MSIISSPTIVGSGGGSQLNIAYGQTAPEDTSKIWVKAEEPTKSKIFIGDKNSGDATIESVGTFPAGPTEQTSYGTVTIFGGQVLVGNEFWCYKGTNGGQYGVVQFNIWNIQTKTYVTKTFTGSADGSYFNRKLTYDPKTNAIYAFWWANANNMIKLDLETEKFSQKKIDENMSRILDGITAVKDGIIYSVNGRKTVFKYNTSTGTASSGATLSTSIQPSTCVLVGDIIYYFGQYSDNSTSSTKTVYKYNITTDTVTELVNCLPVPVAMTSRHCGVIGTNIYIFGTAVSGSDQLSIIKYDTTTDSASVITTKIPAFSKYAASVSYNGGCAIHINSDMYYFYTTWDVDEGTCEFYLDKGDGVERAKIINDEALELQISECKYYYGDSNNKCVQAPVYYHNGTDWVQFT